MCNICGDKENTHNNVEFKCSHEMCRSCFSKWVISSNNKDPKKNITCPYCRTEIVCSTDVNHERAFMRDNMLELMDEYKTPSSSQEQDYLEESLVEYLE